MSPAEPRSYPRHETEPRPRPDLRIDRVRRGELGATGEDFCENVSGAFTPQRPCSPPVCLGARRGPPNQSRRTSPSGCPRPPPRAPVRRAHPPLAPPPPPRQAVTQPPRTGLPRARGRQRPRTRTRKLPCPVLPSREHAPEASPGEATGRPSRPATRNATPPRAREPVPAQPRRAPGVAPRLKQSPEARPAPPRPASPAAPGWPPRRPRRRRGRFPRRPGRRGRGRPASRRR